MSDRRTFIKNGGALLASVPLAAMSAEESQVSARKGKVLLLNGSPHLAGCVYTDLTVIAKTLAEENIESLAADMDVAGGCFNENFFLHG